MSTHNAESPFRGVRRSGLRERWRLAIERRLHKEFPWIAKRLPLGCKSMEDVLNWARSHQEYEVYSFDVFDTLLRRRVDPPEEIKRLVAGYVSGLLREHGVEVSAEEILAQRNRAEEDLQQRSVMAGRDAVCSLDAIVMEMLSRVGAQDLVVGQQVIDYELALELKANEPMPGAREALSYLKSRGKRVIAISDMYLSSDQITRILKCHGLGEHVEELYVSCDVGWRKDTKRLFQYVVEREGRCLVHIGDSYSLDVAAPRDLGVTALWFHSGSEQRRKRRLRRLKDTGKRLHYVNAIVGGVDEKESVNGFYRVGHEIFGPALTVFVHEVAERLKRDGVERVFFVARDGYGMKKVYEELRKSQVLDETYPPGAYLCLSRGPVRLASLRGLSYADILDVHAYMVTLEGKDANLKDVLTSYGMDPGSFADVARRYHVDLGTPVSDLIDERRLRDLLESEDFQGVVNTRSNEARRLLRGYLASVGFMGCRKVAVVDALSEGRTKALLDQAFAEDDDYPVVRGYYFSLIQVAGRAFSQDLSQVSGICHDWRSEREGALGLTGFFGLFLELFTHPNHGVTAGYREVGDRVVPIFRRTPQEGQYRAESQGLRGILSYARSYGMYHSLHQYDCRELIPDVKAGIREWKRLAPRRDIEVLKDLFVTSDWPQERNQALVIQLTARDVFAVRGLRKKIEWSHWPEATLRLVPVPGLLWLYQHTGRLRGMWSP